MVNHPPPFSEKAGPERVRPFCLVERARRALGGIRQDERAPFDYQFAIMAWSPAQERVCRRWHVCGTNEMARKSTNMAGVQRPDRARKQRTRRITNRTFADSQDVARTSMAQPLYSAFPLVSLGPFQWHRLPLNTCNF